MEPPSTRRWLGVGAALSGLPAAGGCFCAALLLALVADSEPGAAYAQEWWLGAAVATGTACAFAAMLGWVTLQRGGLPAPVLLGAVALVGAPFALPSGLFLPAAAAAVAACAGLATYGLARPPASPDGVRRLTGGLAVTAVALAIGQAIAVGLNDSGRPVRAEVKASRATPHTVPAKPHPRPAATRAPRWAKKPAAPRKATRAPRAAAPAPAAAVPTSATTAPPTAAAPPTATAPLAPDPNLREGTPSPAAAPPGAERFVRDYYAALDERRFAAAWRMLAPPAQTTFGGFTKWRRGYARTVANALSELRVTPAGAGATVGLTLRAGDRDACGRTVMRRFAVTWQLARTDTGWRATAAVARALSGAKPAAAC